MFYPDRAATGHAAEYFFAYQITQWFRWPCRLLDVDIGIDAQVEVLNAKSESTGDFFVAQIKGRQEFESQIEITQPHLDYWRSLDHPVFVFQVVLPSSKIYFSRIDSSDSYKGASGAAAGVYVPFSKADQLTKAHQTAFEDLFKEKYAIAEVAAAEIMDTYEKFYLNKHLTVSYAYVEVFGHPVDFAEHIAKKVQLAYPLYHASAAKSMIYANAFECAQEIFKKIAELVDINSGNGRDERTKAFLADPSSLIRGF